MYKPDWDLFEGLPGDQVSEILNLSSNRTASAGEVLFSLGNEANDLFVVVTGEVKLTLPLSIGDRELEVMVGEGKSGSLVGWSGLIPPHRFTVNGIAATEAELLSFSRPSFLAFLEDHPTAGYTVLSNVARIVGHRLQVFQAMWIREMQHVVKSKTS